MTAMTRSLDFKIPFVNPCLLQTKLERISFGRFGHDVFDSIVLRFYPFISFLCVLHALLNSVNQW